MHGMNLLVFFCVVDILLFLTRIKKINVKSTVAGMADKILVNSKFTALTFSKTFNHLDARGIKPAVLYPAVNVNQFDEPRDSYK
jgi:hypothetical protein